MSLIIGCTIQGPNTTTITDLDDISSTSHTSSETSSGTGYRITLTPGIHYIPLAHGTIKPLFFSTGMNANELLSSSTYDIVTNAGFFDYTNDEHTSYRHAGGLVIDGTWISPYATRDTLITHALLWQKNSNTYEIIDNDTFDVHMIRANTHMIQSGPLVLSGGVLLTGALAQSTNNLNKYPRTALIFNKNMLQGIIIATKPITLPALGEVIRAHPLFQQRSISLLNMDGGRSTSYAIRDGPSWNPARRLPARIGFIATS